MRPATLLSLLPVVASSPVLKRSGLAPLMIPRNMSAVLPGKYMVALKDGSSSSALKDVMQLFPGNATHVYEGLFKGFAAALNEASLEALRDHPDVDFIEPDQHAVGAGFEPPSPAPSAHAPLFRRQQSIFDKYFNDANAGEGVCAYVIDSGVDTSHPDFGGRATMIGCTLDGVLMGYESGHGTHVAGTLGGATFGVAKKANIYGIHAIHQERDATPISSAAAGMELVVQDAPQRHCPNGVVVNMSFQFPRSQALNMAAQRLVQRGYFVAAAAGNEAGDARAISPASESSICTVGGAGFPLSNFGPAVDIFAPASDILSTAVGNAYERRTGTSFAAPRVAGLAAAMASANRTRAGPHLCQEMARLAAEAQ